MVYQHHLIVLSALHKKSLLHIVAGCKVYLQQGRYTWRHDSILMLIARAFRSLQHAKIFTDILGFLSTTVLIGEDLQPDLLFSFSNKLLYILGLTDVIDMVKTLKFDKGSTNYIIKNITNQHCYPNSIYIFCRRNKESTEQILNL